MRREVIGMNLFGTSWSTKWEEAKLDLRCTQIHGAHSLLAGLTERQTATYLCSGPMAPLAILGGLWGRGGSFSNLARVPWDCVFERASDSGKQQHFQSFG